MTANGVTPIGADQAIRPIIESDVELTALLAQVSPVVLAMSVVHMTGSLDIIRVGIRPQPPSRHADTSGSLSDDEAKRIQAAALDAIRAWRDLDLPAPYQPTRDELHEMLNFLAGMPLPQGYVPMILEDMAFDGEDPRSFKWEQPVSDTAKRDHPVLVIGAGMSGLLIGLRLKQAGIPFTIVEKNDDVGGTWYENQYPGLRVDVPSHAYSFSFRQDQRWPNLYSKQAELLSYFRDCAEVFGIRDAIRFGVEVPSAVWDEDASVWQVTLAHADMRTEVVNARSIVSAVGFLNRPQIPEFKDAQRFTGISFHSSRWQQDVDLAGKRVAVIGNAATGMQAIPEIAGIAGHLTVFQRSPGWSLINPEYHRPIRDAEQWAIEHLPFFAGWLRTLLFNWAQDLMPEWMKIDPSWPQSNKSVSKINEYMRQRMTADMERVMADRPDLLAKVIPDYPPFVKRPTIQTGNFYEALKRDNVDLVTEAIDRFAPGGIVDTTGSLHEVDVIIYATGFQVQKFLTPMVIRGRNGIELNDYWQDRPGGYLGIAVPNFPNFYMMYGPGTNLGYNGNLIYNSELQAHYIARCIGRTIEQGADAIEVRQSVFDDYMERTGKKLDEFVWSTPYGTTYFRNAQGKVTTNSPWSLLEMWNWTKAPDPDHFKFTHARAEPAH
jgi:4-hydroxyacetophenone monooxygenase